MPRRAHSQAPVTFRRSAKRSVEAGTPTRCQPVSRPPRAATRPKYAPSAASTSRRARYQKARVPTRATALHYHEPAFHPRGGPEEVSITLSRMRRYHVTTFGCQMNAHDSKRIKGLLEELGLGEAPSAGEADVVVFNTCTIREKPDTKLAAHLAEAAARKREDPARVIAVGGCYAEAQRERIFELYPQVDVAFGPGSIAHLGDWLGAGGVGVARGRFGLADRAFAAALPQHRERRYQAWVQVSMGCNSVCSYCIVPSVRGREQSRRPGAILAEI